MSTDPKCRSCFLFETDPEITRLVSRVQASCSRKAEGKCPLFPGQIDDVGADARQEARWEREDAENSAERERVERDREYKEAAFDWGRRKG